MFLFYVINDWFNQSTTDENMTIIFILSENFIPLSLMLCNFFENQCKNATCDSNDHYLTSTA